MHNRNLDPGDDQTNKSPRPQKSQNRMETHQPLTRLSLDPWTGGQFATDDKTTYGWIPFTGTAGIQRRILAIPQLLRAS